jgi:hypothetical protein
MRDPNAGLLNCRPVLLQDHQFCLLQYCCVSLTGTHCWIYMISFYIHFWWDVLWFQSFPAFLNISQHFFVAHFKTLTNTKPPHHTHCMLLERSFLSLTQEGEAIHSGGTYWPIIAEVHFLSWVIFFLSKQPDCPRNAGDEINYQHVQSSFTHRQVGSFCII